jgi:preprotein translocase subunit SecA
LLEQTQERLQFQINERMEAVDTYFEGLTLDDDAPRRRPVDMINEISELVHIPIKLSPDGQRALRDDPQQAADEVRAQIEGSLVIQTVNRLIGSVDRRLEEPVEISASQLDASDWNTLADQILRAVEIVFDNRVNRMLGDGSTGEGQLARKLENALPRNIETVDQNLLYYLLLIMPQGERAFFDKKTHKRIWTRTQNLNYIYYAAHFLENQQSDVIAAEVLDHLERAQEKMFRLWGQREWSQVPGRRVSDLSNTTQQWLLERIGDANFEQIKDMPLDELLVKDKEQLIDLLGRQTLTEIYRQLLLSVITELWVEYLTQMEALRVSIGLEAYAQRDPLVQYKNRAFGLFQELLSNMRYGVVNRMFTFRPRESEVAPSNAQRSIEEQPRRVESPKVETAVNNLALENETENNLDDSEELETATQGATGMSKSQSPPASGNRSDGGKKKRRRHR